MAAANPQLGDEDVETIVVTIFDGIEQHQPDWNRLIKLLAQTNS